MISCCAQRQESERCAVLRVGLSGSPPPPYCMAYIAHLIRPVSWYDHPGGLDGRVTWYRRCGGGHSRCTLIRSDFQSTMNLAVQEPQKSRVRPDFLMITRLTTLPSRWVPIPVVGKTIGGHTNSKQLRVITIPIFLNLQDGVQHVQY